jgi:hypothetical protein
MGLLIVDVSFPPAPSGGTTMPYSRNCGSLITLVEDLTPMAIGCALKISSTIAVSCFICAASFAGSAKPVA